MFIRFVGNDPDVAERTIQCRDYDVQLSKSCRQKVIRILDRDDNLEFALEDRNGEYSRAYLMNDDGHTIETILAPSSEAFQGARVREEGEAS